MSGCPSGHQSGWYRGSMRLSSLVDVRRFLFARSGDPATMDRTSRQDSVSTEPEPAAEPAVEASPVPASAPYALAVEWHCPKCTGPMIRCQVGHVAIYGWWLERTTRSAGMLGPPRTVSTEVEARMCIRCGYTELYALEPGALLTGDERN